MPPEQHPFEPHEIGEAVGESRANRLPQRLGRIVEVEAVELADRAHGATAVRGPQLRYELAELGSRRP